MIAKHCIVIFLPYSERDATMKNILVNIVNKFSKELNLVNFR